MQRLGCANLVRRVVSGSMVSAAVSQSPSRFCSNYVNKVAKKKVEQGDDERWLEAEMDENINTPEERYAHARELENIKRMVAQLKKDHAEQEDAVKENDSEVEQLKKQVDEMQRKIADLSKRMK